MPAPSRSARSPSPLAFLVAIVLVLLASSTHQQLGFVHASQIPSQIPFQVAASKPFGRFLHITDLHPDTFYKYGSAVNAGCHHNKPKRRTKQGRWRAGWWGTGVSDCDSPPRLVTSSLKWIARNWLPRATAIPPPFSSSTEAIATDDTLRQHPEPPRNSTAGFGFDFIFWTGDSARHDIDDKVPRTLSEIFELNRWTLHQIEDAFPGVPIVPSLGNNDIFPHNIMFPGPSAITKEFVRIWADHIPEYEFHTFEQGGYFVKELLPNRLAAMSLNTLYFYDSNKAVDGCAKTKKRHGESEVDPGTAQLDWLEVQLDLLRKRKMQAHLLGHVPPTAGNYFPRCYKRYTDIVLRYQDTVVGQHFGHMNTDAFFIQEDQKAVKSAEEDDDEEEYGYESGNEDESTDEDSRGQITAEGEVGIRGDEGLPDDLRQDFSSLPGKARTNQDYYLVFFVAPSVIPTYYPSIRVWTYNTTEEGRYEGVSEAPTDEVLDGVEQDVDDNEDVEESDNGDVELPIGTNSRHHHRPLPDKDRKKRRKKHKKKKKKKHGRRPPRHTSPDAPSRTDTYLSLLGYSQWVMDIDEQNQQIEDLLDGKDRGQGAGGFGGKGDGWFKGAKKGDQDKDEKKRRRKEAEKAEVEYRLEYTTYEPRTLWQDFIQPHHTKAGPRQPLGPVPVPRHLLQAELQKLDVHPDVLASTADAMMRTRRKWKPPKAIRKFTDYALPAITVDSMLDLGRRLVVDRKLWKRFVKRIYSESGLKGKS